MRSENPDNKNRIYFLDNLRTFMVFLVVLLHSGLVYDSSGIGAFFWIVYDSSTNHLAGTLFLIMDIFIMSTIFFISGYVTPVSLKKRSKAEFIKTKFRRLMIPWAIAVIALMPLYKVIFLYARNMPQQNWTTYFHWNNGFSQSWLWFLPVLFLFDLIYLFFSGLKIKWPKVSLKTAVPVLFFLGVCYSYLLDVFNGRGWTKTVVLDFQNERLLIYFLMFLLGVLCAKLGIFEATRKPGKWYIAAVCTVWIPLLLYRMFYYNSFLAPGNEIISQTADTALLWINFHLTLLGLVYVMLSTFRLFFNRQGNIRKVMNRNSYPVYIIHTIVLGGIALLLLDMKIPSQVKYLILTLATYTVSQLLAFLYGTVINVLKHRSNSLTMN